MSTTVPILKKWTTEKIVPGMRWLKRGDSLVLQQYFAITTHEDPAGIIGYHGEWRDVPIETDGQTQ
jgi:hypothetical protein